MDSLAHRVGDNEWYIDYGAWGFNILTDTSLIILNAPFLDDNVKHGPIYVFEADDETMNKCGNNLTLLKSKCPQLDWRTLPHFVEPFTDDDDEIAF